VEQSTPARTRACAERTGEDTRERGDVRDYARERGDVRDYAIHKRILAIEREAS
jgi:hypothetical protein